MPVPSCDGIHYLEFDVKLSNAYFLSLKYIWSTYYKKSRKYTFRPVKQVANAAISENRVCVVRKWKQLFNEELTRFFLSECFLSFLFLACFWKECLLIKTCDRLPLLFTKLSLTTNIAFKSKMFLLYRYLINRKYFSN